jgi:stage II sporulation protein E
MVSDGAINDGEDWIEKIIFDWQEKSMQELSDLINDEACRRRCDGHDDDITVIAMRLKAA